MTRAKTFYFLGSFLLLSSYAIGQSGYMDNALNYNQIIKEKTADGVYKLVGVFKVTGTSFLFGEKNKGDLYSPDAQAQNISLSYNTYNQEVEFYSSSNPDKPLVKEPGTVDSFFLHSNAQLGIANKMKFVYGSLLGSTEKSYFLEIYSGKRFSIYKRYKS